MEGRFSSRAFAAAREQSEFLSSSSSSPKRRRNDEMGKRILEKTPKGGDETTMREGEGEGEREKERERERETVLAMNDVGIKI